MVKKITYSRKHDKRQAPYDPDFAKDELSGRKRARSDDTEELRLPNRARNKAKSRLHNSARKFDGQTSVPHDLVDEDTRRSSNTTFIWDKVDKKKDIYPQVLPKQNNIYGSREDFDATILKGKMWKQDGNNSRNVQLPTPPAEGQKGRQIQHKGSRTQAASRTNSVANKYPSQVISSSSLPSAAAHLIEKAIQTTVLNDRKPHGNYAVKAYECAQTAPPNRDMPGNRLSKKSKEVQM